MGCNQAQLKEMNPQVSLHLVIKNPLRNEMMGGRISASRPYAVISDEGRGNRCCSFKTSRSGWRLSRLSALMQRGQQKRMQFQKRLGKSDFGEEKQSVYSCIVINYTLNTGCIMPYRYLKQIAQKLHDYFDSDVPKTVDDLCSLPGLRCRTQDGISGLTDCGELVRRAPNDILLVSYRRS